MIRLLVDLGNTNCKWAVCLAGRFVRQGVVAYHVKEALVEAMRFAVDTPIDELWVSNVAGIKGTAWLDALCQQMGWPRPICHHTTLGLQGQTKLQTDYAGLGIDRLLAMLAAYRQLNRDCLVLDAGTALTLDAIDSSARHLGGVILPGFQSMGRALTSNTAGIRHVDGCREAVFANSTADAVATGVYYAVLGGVKEVIFRMRQESSVVQDVVVTGGDGPLLLPMLRTLECTIHSVPDLVLQGLAQVAADGIRPCV